MSKIADWKALHYDVLVVAVIRVEGAWCAYIKGVPGQNHDREIELVREFGGKLPENVALAIFPQFIGRPYAW